MKRYLLLFLLLCTVFSVSAFAADVDFKVSDASAMPGDEITLTFSVESHVDINSVAFKEFKYDKNSLEFVGFTACEGLSKLTALPATLDNSKMAVAIALKKTSAHCIDLFTATFKVKETAEYGDLSVSATAIAKKSSTSYETALTPGTVTVSCFSVKGTSLVLDGAIGVKTYYGVADIIDAAGAVAEITVYDSDIEENVSQDTVGLAYDSDKGMYYTVAYIAPKDVDNRYVNITVKYTLNGNAYSEELEPITVGDYIEEFKALAEEYPDSEYSNALALVEKMEAYTKYADNYFGNDAALETVTADTDAIANVQDATASGTASGIELYATSLVLEDKTTIRHYFTYTGDYTKHTFKVGGKTLTPVKKGNLIYVDIEDIVAQDMDTVYTLTVSDKLTVNYSVLNYVKLAVNDTNAKISNLVKALFNYYQQAEEYVK